MTRGKKNIHAELRKSAVTIEALALPRYYLEDQFREFDELLSSNGVVEHYRKGEELKSTGELFDRCFLIKNGLVKLCLCHERGYVKTMAYYGEYSMIPLYSPAEKTRLENDLLIVEAIADTTVISVKQEVIRELMLEHPYFHLRITDSYVRMVTLLMFEEVNQLYNDALTKTCNLLYALSEGMHTDSINASQEEIADMSGGSRVNIARNFNELRKMNVIETTRRNIRILDLAKLRKLCSSDFS